MDNRIIAELTYVNETIQGKITWHYFENIPIYHVYKLHRLFPPSHPEKNTLFDTHTHAPQFPPPPKSIYLYTRTDSLPSKEMWAWGWPTQTPAHETDKDWQAATGKHSLSGEGGLDGVSRYGAIGGLCGADFSGFKADKPVRKCASCFMVLSGPTRWQWPAAEQGLLFGAF